MKKKCNMVSYAGIHWETMRRVSQAYIGTLGRCTLTGEEAVKSPRHVTLIFLYERMNDTFGVKAAYAVYIGVTVNYATYLSSASLILWLVEVAYEQCISYVNLSLCLPKDIQTFVCTVLTATDVTYSQIRYSQMLKYVTDTQLLKRHLNEYCTYTPIRTVLTLSSTSVMKNSLSYAQKLSVFENFINANQCKVDVHLFVLFQTDFNQTLLCIAETVDVLEDQCKICTATALCKLKLDKFELAVGLNGSINSNKWYH